MFRLQGDVHFLPHGRAVQRRIVSVDKPANAGGSGYVLFQEESHFLERADLNLICAFKKKPD